MELDGCWWTFSCDLVPEKGTNCWSSLLQNGNFSEISTVKDRQTKLWGHVSVRHQLQTAANIRVGTTNITIKWYINFSFFKNNYFFIHYFRSSLCYCFFFIWFCNLFYSMNFLFNDNFFHCNNCNFNIERHEYPWENSSFL